MWHCQRRTSTTTLKRHEKSDVVATGYIENSVERKTNITKRIFQPGFGENVEQFSFNKSTTSNGSLKKFTFEILAWVPIL